MLESLNRLSTPKDLFEIIIVNNGSTDDTAAVISDFSHQFSGNVLVIDETRPGLSIARNTGWRRASGPYIAFTDDDCYPAENYLDTVVAAFEKHNADYLGGRVLLFDPDDAPVTIALSEDLFVQQPFTYVASGRIHGANLCFRRSVLERLGGFDVFFGAGAALRAGEDTDMMMRATGSGCLGVYDPSLVVSHHHRRRARSDIDSLERGYAYGRGALAAKAVSMKDLRGLYARHFYWQSRSLVRRGQWRELGHELRGFTDYFAVRGLGRPIFGK